jgi:POT family proton-dependent oligopeptide transporter
LVTFIGEHGWGYGFGLAGIGMVLGLSVFDWPNICGLAEPANPAKYNKK